jgi:release factor glutamine methyltransferase
MIGPPGNTGPVTSWDTLIARSALPRLDARALLEHVSGRSRTWLLAHGDEPVPPDHLVRFEQLRARRARGEPLAYLLGEREFMGHRFAVGPEVLVPRPETEHLVEFALERGDRLEADRRSSRVLRVLDLGTGSGAIALSVALARPQWQLTASDDSAPALACAQTNAQTLGVTCVQWRHGPWWQALQPDDPPFDLVLSNPPYLADDDPHLDDPALGHEPRQALASGPRGLESLECIALGAPEHLTAGGWILLEHGATQGSAVRDLLRQAGFSRVCTAQDLAGLDRVTMGQIPEV